MASASSGGSSAPTRFVRLPFDLNEQRSVADNGLQGRAEDVQRARAIGIVVIDFASRATKGRQRCDRRPTIDQELAICIAYRVSIGTVCADISFGQMWRQVEFDRTVFIDGQVACDNLGLI